MKFIKKVQTLVVKSHYHFRNAGDGKDRALYYEYLRDMYDIHNDEVNCNFHQLENNEGMKLDSYNTREVIFHRNNNGYEDKFMIITDIHYHD